MRSIFPLLAVAALSLSLAPQSAEAGLFGCFKSKSSCCELCCPAPEPSCCAPVQTCCVPAAVCCEPAPVCCEPAPCCDPCGKPRCKLFSGMFKKCFSRHRSNSCCTVPEPCCAPEAVSCCAPAMPSCAAPAPCCGM